ncbi:hypothetical protein DFP72DRAFT_1068660 [Ephemerocybe angulata]|uniref:C2H2-type domain-containing protein n=1 Tax=Ephemerocybe angulata TaxID=980116 RepID=A0A8H6HWG9_9AGAR|nr:hypothetical protein DFP72DRAFT_1068660 [Tulosesus angulatus]
MPREYISSSPEQPYQSLCRDCDEAVWDLEAHSYECRGIASCRDCEALEGVPDALRYHRLYNHGYCSECDEFQGSYDLLKRHWTALAPHYRCTHRGCPEYFNTPSNLQEHLDSKKHIEADMDCIFECGMVFVDTSAMVAHYVAGGCPCINRHQLNTLIFNVDVNNSQFIVDGAVEPLQTYGSERYDMIQDDLEYARANLNFNCREPGCRARYRSLKPLAAHLNSPAHDPLIYRCRFCNKRFQTLCAVTQHIGDCGCGYGTSKIMEQIRALLIIADGNKTAGHE